jgi:hypothetical protein
MAASAISPIWPRRCSRSSEAGNAWGRRPRRSLPPVSCRPRGNPRAGSLIDQASMSRTPGPSGYGDRGPHRPEFGTPGRDGRAGHVGHRSRRGRRDLRGNRQTLAKAAHRHCSLEAAGVSGSVLSASAVQGPPDDAPIVRPRCAGCRRPSRSSAPGKRGQYSPARSSDRLVSVQSA